MRLFLEKYDDWVNINLDVGFCELPNKQCAVDLKIKNKNLLVLTDKGRIYKFQDNKLKHCKYKGNW
jgi:hypothetical protein